MLTFSLIKKGYRSARETWTPQSSRTPITGHVAGRCRRTGGSMRLTTDREATTVRPLLPMSSTFGGALRASERPNIVDQKEFSLIEKRKQRFLWAPVNPHRLRDIPTARFSRLGELFTLILYLHAETDFLEPRRRSRPPFRRRSCAILANHAPVRFRPLSIATAKKPK